LPMNRLPSRDVLDCAGRAKRRRRFRMTRDARDRTSVGEKSGVASDLPPQSKTLADECRRLGGSGTQCAVKNPRWLPMPWKLSTFNIEHSTSNGAGGACGIERSM